MRRLLAQLLTSLLAMIVSWPIVAHASAPPTTESGGVGGTTIEVVQSWALTPVGGVDTNGASTRPDLSYVLEPGAVQEDAVTLFNFGNVQMDFRVYATDAFTTSDGEFSALSGDQEPVDVGSWVELAQERVTVAPGKQVTIPFTITVPPDANPGDHAGAILASSFTDDPSNPGDEVIIDRRTGTRLYLRVAGDLQPELSVTAVEADYDQHVLNPFGGALSVTYRIENRGNVRMGGKAVLKVTGLFGLSERTVELPDVPDLLPGETITVVKGVEGVPALVRLHATVTLSPRLDGANAGDSSSRSDTVFAPPVLVLVLLLMLIMAVLGFRAVRRGRVVGTSEN